MAVYPLLCIDVYAAQCGGRVGSELLPHRNAPVPIPLRNVLPVFAHDIALHIPIPLHSFRVNRNQ